jgi:hypothetical protein
MRISYLVRALTSALPLTLLAGQASAHIDLVSPPPRLQGEAGGGQLKTKPCGQTNDMRTTDKVTTYAPGQKVDVKIKEYINHPGYFAVAFDPDGDDSFPFPRANMDKVVAATDDPKALFPLSDSVLGIRTDKDQDCYTEAADNSHECTISITIPNMTCQNCTLQVTQFMYDKLGDNNDNEYYYQCADIKIEGTPVGGAGGAGGGGGAAAGGGGAGGTASGGTATAGAGGSAVGTGGTGAATGGTSAGSSGGPIASAGTATAGGTTSAAGGSGTPTSGATSSDSGGCGLATRTHGGASLVAAAGLLFALGRRRRAR